MFISPSRLDDVSNFIHELSELSRQHGVVLFNTYGLSVLQDLLGNEIGLRLSDWQGDSDGYGAVADGVRDE